MSNVEVIIEEKDVQARIQDMADAISETHKDEELLFIGILNGSVFFLTELAKRMSVPVEIDFMEASSYGSGTVSSGDVIITKELSRSVKGKHVVIVEDILDTGRTLKSIYKLLQERKPLSVEVVTLLDKPDRRVVDFEADYVGFRIPDVFVVGYGLDFDQKYRDLPFVGVIKD